MYRCDGQFTTIWLRARHKPPLPLQTLYSSVPLHRRAINGQLRTSKLGSAPTKRGLVMVASCDRLRRGVRSSNVVAVAAIALLGAGNSNRAPSSMPARSWITAAHVRLDTGAPPTVPKVPFNNQPCLSVSASDLQAMGAPAVTQGKPDRAPHTLPIDNMCTYVNGGSQITQIGYMTDQDYKFNSTGNRSTSHQAPASLPGGFYDQQGGLWFAKDGYDVVVGQASTRNRSPRFLAGSSKRRSSRPRVAVTICRIQPLPAVVVTGLAALIWVATAGAQELGKDAADEFRHAIEGGATVAHTLDSTQFLAAVNQYGPLDLMILRHDVEPADARQLREFFLGAVSGAANIKVKLFILLFEKCGRILHHGPTRFSRRRSQCCAIARRPDPDIEPRIDHRGMAQWVGRRLTDLWTIWLRYAGDLAQHGVLTLAATRRGQHPCHCVAASRRHHHVAGGGVHLVHACTQPDGGRPRCIRRSAGRDGRRHD